LGLPIFLIFFYGNGGVKFRKKLKKFREHRLSDVLDAIDELAASQDRSRSSFELPEEPPLSHVQQK